ncbi:SDR family NAD(P)-dependent oxidoreductase [Phenylobacterium sp.]|uniref:SDR family NAD(P)-dependent oxidoreductase n=1 Tax=Phenylobacterium sp. TaxID=1871053 RepID=UPI0025EA0C55|nr:SDR family NAD(P)-dependent oxidoreductase [Phenylobacterium sp.]
MTDNIELDTAPATQEAVAVVGSGRLAGKVALVTGAAGNFGSHIVERFLIEGARVVLTGRNLDKLNAARARLVEAAGVPDNSAIALRMDGADPTDVRAAIADTLDRFGRLDVVVNNAGSSGPKRRLADVPITRRELGGESETMGDAARNLLAVPWNVARAAAPHLKPGASIINVSTIFSRTEYFGRTGYVVPKAAMNALSRRLAAEFGAHGVRVNTVYPGPIESERIRTVFSAMDQLREQAEGATAGDFFRRMTLSRAFGDEPPEHTFPVVADVVNAILFLASDESAAINGQDLEVTHGLETSPDSSAMILDRPGLRTVDGAGSYVLVVAGDDLQDALAVARIQAGCGAKVIFGAPSGAHLHASMQSLRTGEDEAQIVPVLADRTSPETLAAVLREHGGDGRLSSAIIFPAMRRRALSGPLREALDSDVDAFIDRELVGAVTVARELTRYWKGCEGLDRTPRAIFLTHGDDGHGNAYAELLRAAVGQLARIWRDESAHEASLGHRGHAEWVHQVVRYTNTEPEGLAFAGGEAARLIFKDRRAVPIDLVLPPSLSEATGARRSALGWTENLLGLHKGKVALITGGSSGIGGQIARLLAIAGARVMLVSRGAEQLQEMRDRIVEELESSGYSGGRRRVQILAGVDVADLASVEHAATVTLKTFGHVDYLINCAGIAGAEEMVVDMPLDAWRRTLDANLISNYALIQRLAHHMKKRGAGYVINVSSYFGGERYVSIPYPNRSDYATSKAGQRAMAENLARFLGPEIQINALSPGPVEGERLRGASGRAGLYERRARLIMERRRLGAVHALLVKASREGAAVGPLLERLAENRIADLAADPAAPDSVRDALQRLSAEGKEGASCGEYLLTPVIAEKLISRLSRAGLFLAEADKGARFSEAWLKGIVPPPEPFMPPTAVSKEAERIRGSVISLLHLQRMPTELEVAQATVFYLADRAVSGESFQPSGGLSVERSSTERELFGGTRHERIEALEGRTVWLVGEHLTAHLAQAATAFVAEGKVGQVVLVTRSEAGAAAVLDAAGPEVAAVSRTIVAGDDLEAALARALEEGGASPATVICTPFDPLPDAIFDPTSEQQPLDTAGFRQLVEANLTHHFRVAARAALFDDVQLVLVAPDVPAGGSAEAFALANFVKTTLHSFTGTLAVECERIVNNAVVNQINLTRRVRSEEPANQAETEEELARFGRAVLLAGAPIPHLQDSRYRSRIYRGMAITV